jgi:hypothetical protein
LARRSLLHPPVGPPPWLESFPARAGFLQRVGLPNCYSVALHHCVLISELSALTSEQQAHPGRSQRRTQDGISRVLLHLKHK